MTVLHYLKLSHYWLKDRRKCLYKLSARRIQLYWRLSWKKWKKRYWGVESIVCKLKLCKRFQGSILCGNDYDSMKDFDFNSVWLENKPPFPCWAYERSVWQGELRRRNKAETSGEVQSFVLDPYEREVTWTQPDETCEYSSHHCWGVLKSISSKNDWINLECSCWLGEGIPC